MFLVTSPIVINVPTRGLLAVETMHAIVQWLENLNIKRNMTSMFVNKKYRYSTYESRERLNSFSLSMVSEISQTEYVRRLQNSTKEILQNWPS